MSWLTLSLVAMVCWGFWALLIKVAFNHFNWYQVYIITSIVPISTSLLLYLYFKPIIDTRSPGFFYAIFAGVLGSIAVVAFYTALAEGNVSIIVPLTAVYPAITTILSYLLLHERTTLLQSLGVVLAIIAIILISIE
ncbi:MAG: EamA-like transporter family protein [Candidatus Bathyarchaeota archaeon BA1]|nr:MAG: EamA-like transporter family protein [Candidatus Bathyarchaeota archaeon BA1]